MDRHRFDAVPGSRHQRGNSDPVGIKTMPIHNIGCKYERYERREIIVRGQSYFSRLPKY